MSDLDDNPIFSDPREDDDDKDQGDPNDAEDVAEKVRGGSPDSGSSSDKDSKNDDEDDSDSGIVIDTGDRSSGGGGGGGSSSSSSSDDSDSSDDDSRNVVVSGDPSKGEDVEVVGRGDTKQEAQASAAANPRFDADDGTEIDRIEDRIGANPGNAVTVTGDPSKGEDVEVVGRGESRFESDLNAAANPRFDADQGSRVDALETLQGQGLGDGTDPEEIALQRRMDTPDPEPREFERNRTRFEETAIDLQRQANENNDRRGFEDNPKFTDIETFVNPLDGNPNANFFEEATTAGVDLMRKGENFGDTIGEGVPRREDDIFIPTPPTGLERGIASIDAGVESGQQALEDGEIDEEDLRNIALDVGEQQVGVSTEAQLDAREDLVSGAATGGTQLGGLAVSTVGAVPLAAEETGRNLNPELESEGPGLVEGAATGPGLVADDISDDPAEFIGEEIGEEVGEKIVFAPLGGAALAASSVPTPEFTPSTEAGTTDFQPSNSASIGQQSRIQRDTEVPSNENLPDLGERAIGRDRIGVQEEPQNQFAGENFVDREVSQPEPGREAGVPDDRSGFTDEEIEVLRRRREQKEGVENVEAEIREFSDDTSIDAAEEVSFSQQGREIMIEESFDASQFMGVGLPGIEVTTRTPSTNPDATPSSDQTRTGRVEIEGDESINIIEDRSQSSPVPESDFTLQEDTVNDAEEAFRTEEMAVFGSPLEDTDELIREPVSDRLTREAQLNTEDNNEEEFFQAQTTGVGAETSTEELTGIGNNQRDLTGIPEQVEPPAVGLQETGDVTPVVTRQSPGLENPVEEEASLFSVNSQDTSPESSQRQRPLDENALAPARGQMPDFREDFIHSEEQGLEQTPVFEQEFAPEFRQDTRFENDNRGRPESIPEGIPDPEVFPQENTPRVEAFPEPGRGRDFDFGGEEESLGGFNEGFGNERNEEPQAAPDLTSLVFGGGETGVGSPGNPATGLERRAPIEEPEEEEDEFFPPFL